jgi:hypothetical protein
MMLKKKETAEHRLKLLDTVELRIDAVESGVPPFGGSVAAGTLGTVVDELRDNFYLVEFGTEKDEEPAILTLHASALLRRP